MVGIIYVNQGTGDVAAQETAVDLLGHIIDTSIQSVDFQLATKSLKKRFENIQPSILHAESLYTS